MPTQLPQQILLLLIPILLTITVHESAHGLAALLLGDDTAQKKGRLSLNPLRHLDPIGTLMLFLFKFGWAKPVPINMHNFKNPRRDLALVALAGPLSNFALAFLFLLFMKIAPSLEILRFLPNPVLLILRNISILIIIINISFAIFNLIPVPPLDGFKLLSACLPSQWVKKLQENSIFFLIILIALLYTGYLGKFLGPAVHFFLWNFMGVFYNG